jgi:ABC-type glycerol-3-phosphate transport system substrate-binding protein
MIALSSMAVAAPKRIELEYWEKWTRFEGEAMAAVVKAFNESQDRIHVTYTMVSDVSLRTLLATAGGNPPDLAGLFDYNVVPFADKNTLVPLDDYMAKAGIAPDHFLPVFLGGCRYRGKTWALPTTPATVALHWNKEMFAAAGLDPEKPPRTIAELDVMAERLTRRDRSGKLTQMGFLPWEPGWWNWAWPHYFGGRLWDGQGNITCNEPEAIASFRWVQSYAKKYGATHVQVFASGFGNFASPQNAFMAGKVAMEMQGTWMYNFIYEYAPKMKWGAAPFPTVDPKFYGMSIADQDVIVIPRDCKHPDEAFEFIKFVVAQKGMEQLCLGQRKFSPLTDVSPEFYRTHPHPYIKLFADMARNPLSFMLPQLTFWDEYNEELNVAFQKTYLMQSTPEEALNAVKQKMQKRMDRELRRLRRLGLVPA